MAKRHHLCLGFSSDSMISVPPHHGPSAYSGHSGHSNLIQFSTLMMKSRQATIVFRRTKTTRTRPSQRRPSLIISDSEMFQQQLNRILISGFSPRTVTMFALRKLTLSLAPAVRPVCRRINHYISNRLLLDIISARSIPWNR